MHTQSKRISSRIGCVVVAALIISGCDAKQRLAEKKLAEAHAAAAEARLQQQAQPDGPPSVAPIDPDEGRPQVPWSETRGLRGKIALVSGEVVSVGHTPRVHFLDFSRTDREAFKIVIFTESLENFSDSLENLYEGKTIQVRGTISDYKGNPQLVVGRPAQIRIVDAIPPTWLPPEPVRRKVGDEVTVSSFNVRNLFDAALDPYHNDDSTPVKPRAELEQLAEVIRELDADVLALQEVENRGYLARFIEVLLGDLGYQQIVHFEGNDLRGIDVCLVSRLPVGAVTSHRHLGFEDDNGNWRRFGRDVLRVEIEPNGGTSFEVWVVHLKSNADGRKYAEPIRLAESRQLREIYETALARDPEAAIIVCGDFNDTIDSDTLQIILGNDDDKRLIPLFDEVPEDQRITYNREPHRSMIDFILCSPAMHARWVSDSYEIRLGTLEESGSDHNPVSTRFRIGESRNQYKPDARARDLPQRPLARASGLY